MNLMTKPKGRVVTKPQNSEIAHFPKRLFCAQMGGGRVGRQGTGEQVGVFTVLII